LESNTRPLALKGCSDASRATAPIPEDCVIVSAVSITGTDGVHHGNLQTSFNKSVRDLSGYVSGNTPPTDCSHP